MRGKRRGPPTGKYTVVTHAERCPRCGVRYVNLQAHMVRKHGAAGHAGDDSRLSPNEQKVVKLVTEHGMTIAQMVAHTGWTEMSVRTALCRARRKGAPLPARMTRSPNKRAVPIALLLEERERIVALRVCGVYSRIARKLRLNAAAVRSRLWKYDKRQRAAAALERQGQSA